MSTPMHLWQALTCGNGEGDLILQSGHSLNVEPPQLLYCICTKKVLFDAATLVGQLLLGKWHERTGFLPQF